jgi:uncharacterized OB-fold protein
MKVPESGKAFIEGHRCTKCGAAYLEPHIACPRCFDRSGLATFQASNRGKVHTYTVVHRSYPGVKTPFVSVIVDLDDGLVLKGTLEGVEPVPSDKLFGLPVRMAFKPVDKTNAQGSPYVIYYFEPA